MTEQKALVLFEEMSALKVGGMDRNAMIEYGKQLREILPDAQALSPINAFKWGMYCATTRANPFRGEIYAWQDKDGNLLMAEGFKLLVRWAENQAPFTHWYEREDPKSHGLSDNDLVVRAYVLREDKIPIMNKLIAAGFERDEAERRVVVTSVGVVLVDEMFIAKDWDKNARGRRGAWKPRTRAEWWPKDPPKGWTWETRAETRALKNTLKRSHGVPTDEELAQASWRVDDVETIPSDWKDVTPAMSTHEAEQTAALSARARQWSEGWDELSEEEQKEQFADNVEALRGPDEDPLSEEALRVEPKGNGEDVNALKDEIAVALAELDDDEAVPDGKIQNRVQRVMSALGIESERGQFPMNSAAIEALLGTVEALASTEEG